MQFEDWEAEGDQGWLPYSCGPLRGVQAQALGRSMLDAVPTVPAWQAAGSSRSRGESLRVSEHRAGYLVMPTGLPYWFWGRCRLLSVPQAFIPSSTSSLEQKTDVRLTTWQPLSLCSLLTNKNLRLKFENYSCQRKELTRICFLNYRYSPARILTCSMSPWELAWPFHRCLAVLKELSPCQRSWSESVDLTESPSRLELCSL